MNKMFKNETENFTQVVKWFVLATVIGVAVGFSNAAFLIMLDEVFAVTHSVKYYYLVLPIGMLAVFLTAKYVAPKHTDSSTTKAIDRINKMQSISFISGIKSYFLSIITMAIGGSVGKEAPCADMGASLGSSFANLFKFSPKDRRKLMVCGISAGFAGIFGVPISGAIFGLEVIRVGNIFYGAMFPALVSGITAFQVTKALGIDYTYHQMDFLPIFSEWFFFKVILAALLFGFASIVFIKMLHAVKVPFRLLGSRFGEWTKPVAGGVVLIVTALVSSPAYLGLGVDTIDRTLMGYKVDSYGFLLKMFTTAVTFAAGGVGGIVTPILFIGSTLGSTMAHFAGLDVRTFAALGFVAVLSGTTRTPIACSIMAIEIFGTQIAPYASVACIISFLMTGYQSVFPSQVWGYYEDYDDSEASNKPISKMKRRR